MIYKVEMPQTCWAQFIAACSAEGNIKLFKKEHHSVLSHWRIATIEVPDPAQLFTIGRRVGEATVTNPIPQHER